MASGTSAKEIDAARTNRALPVDDIAVDIVQMQLDQDLDDVSSEEVKLKNRRNWTFLKCSFRSPAP